MIQGTKINIIMETNIDRIHYTFLAPYLMLTLLKMLRNKQNLLIK